MQSTSLVVDEWLIHDLRGDNGEKRQTEALQFLEKVMVKCDRLVLLRGSQWMKKAYKLAKETQPRLRLVSKFLHGSFILNSLKSITLNRNEISTLPEMLRTAVSSADSYLVALHRTVAESILVTSDEDLARRLFDFQDMTIRLRDEFLKEYLKTNNTKL